MGKEKLYATFTINEGVTLTVNGFVYVNAITGRNQGGTQVQNISGDYSQIELNGKIIVSQTGTLESAGKIYGSGEIEVLQGGRFGETFVVRGWRGDHKQKVNLVALIWMEHSRLMNMKCHM